MCVGEFNSMNWIRWTAFYATDEELSKFKHTFGVSTTVQTPEINQFKMNCEWIDGILSATWTQKCISIECCCYFSQRKFTCYLCWMNSFLIQLHFRYKLSFHWKHVWSLGKLLLSRLNSTTTLLDFRKLKFIFDWVFYI